MNSFLRLSCAVSLTLAFAGEPAFARKSAGTAPRDARKSDQPNQFDLGARWQILGAANEPGAFETVVMQRYVPLLDTAIVASTLSQTTTFRKGPGPKSFEAVIEEARKLANPLREAAQGPKWTEERFPALNAVAFRADWTKQNRFVQIFYRDLGDRVSVSTSLTRRIFILPVAAEASAIQQRMAGGARAGSTAAASERGLRELIAQALMPEAVAQMSPATATAFTLDVAGRPLTLTYNPNNLNALYGQLQTNTAQLLGQGRGFYQGALADTRAFADGVGADAQARAVSTGRTLIAEGEAAARRTVDYAGVEARRDIDYARDQALAVERQTMNDARNLLKQTFSPRNIAIGAAVGAGVAGVVGIAVNTLVPLMVDGTAAVVSSLYHSIMGTLTEAQKAELSGEGRAGLQQLNEAWSSINVLEAELDKRISALTLVAGHGGANAAQMAERLSLAMLHNNRELVRATDDFNRSRSRETDAQCEQRILKAKDLKGKLEQTMAVIVGDRGVAGVCGNMFNMLRAWRAAENALHQAKMRIGMGSSAIISGVMGELANTHRRGYSDRRTGNTCTQYEREMERLRSRANDAPSTACMSRYFADKGVNPASPPPQLVAEATRHCQGAVQEEMAALTDAYRSVCAANGSVQRQRDMTEDLRLGMSLAARAAADAQQSIRDIMAGACEPTDQSEVCQGRVGVFRVIQAKYKNLIAKAQAVCPGMNFESLVDGPNGPVTIDPSRPSGGWGSVVPIMQANGTPVSRIEPSQPGLLRRAWSATANFFSSLWPF